MVVLICIVVFVVLLGFWVLVGVLLYGKVYDVVDIELCDVVIVFGV